MITIDGKTFRNLEEQVLWNQEQINLIKTAEITLADFGIKVIDTFANVAALYAKYPEDEFTGDFGDACAVGEEAPYTYYVWTRTTIEGNKGYWFDVGVFPAPGATGATGAQGPQGPQGNPGQNILSGEGAPSSTSYQEGSLYMNTTTGAVYKLTSGTWVVVANLKGATGDKGDTGDTGATGAQGPQGPQGPQGDVGGFIQIIGHVDNEGSLPDPGTLTNRTWAYLVGNDNELYVQVPTVPGGSTYVWQNFGELNVATYCTVGGDFVNIFNLDTKLDKVTTTTTYGQVYGKAPNGNQFMINRSNANLADALIQRDSSGRAQVANPSETLDIANKQYVDSNLPSIIRG